MNMNRRFYYAKAAFLRIAPPTVAIKYLRML